MDSSWMPCIVLLCAAFIVLFLCIVRLWVAPVRSRSRMHETPNPVLPEQEPVSDDDLL